MSGGVNFATLLGHVGADPDVRATGSGGKVASFSLATSESWRDKATGDRKERTEWHRIVIFSEHLVALAEQYIRKGSKLYIRGTIRTRKYEKGGVERYATEIVLSGFSDQIVLLDKAEGGRPPPAGDVGDYGTVTDRPAALAPPAGAAEDFDDEIPF